MNKKNLAAAALMEGAKVQVIGGKEMKVAEVGNVVAGVVEAEEAAKEVQQNEINALLPGVKVKAVNGYLTGKVLIIERVEVVANSTSGKNMKIWYLVDSEGAPVKPSVKGEKIYFTSPQIKELLGICKVASGKFSGITRTLCENDIMLYESKLMHLIDRANNEIAKLNDFCEKHDITKFNAISGSGKYGELKVWFSAKLEAQRAKVEQQKRERIAKDGAKAQSISGYTAAFVTIKALRAANMDDDAIIHILLASGHAAHDDAAKDILTAYNSTQK